MSKKRRKNKQITTPEKEKKKFPIKKALITSALVTVAFCIYQVMIYFEQIWIMHVYWIASTLAISAYIIINRGVFRVPKPNQISNELTTREKNELISLIEKRRKATMPLLYVLVALLFSLLYDTAYIFVTLNWGK